MPDLQHPRIPGKTVYILGAGFSADAGLPLIWNFIPEGMEILKKVAWRPRVDLRDKIAGEAKYPKESKDAEDLLTLVHQLLIKYMPLLRAYSDVEPTIEDLFGFIDFGDMGGNPAIREDRDLLVRFIRMVCELAYKNRHKKDLESLNSGGNSLYAKTVPHIHCPSGLDGYKNDIDSKAKLEICAYKAFLLQVVKDAKSSLNNPPTSSGLANWKCSSAIISLNYDLLLEEKIQEISKTKSPSIRYWSRKSGLTVSGPGEVQDSCESRRKPFPLPLIKLHGSLNWRMKAGGESPLILPTWRRGPVDGAYRMLMDDAKLHLRLASKVVIIGYSLPIMDRYIRYLLIDGLNTPELPAFEICNLGWNAARCKEAMTSMLGQRLSTETLVSYSGGFVEYVLSRTEQHSFGVGSEVSS